MLDILSAINTALQQDVQRLDITSQNLANVQTPAYKKMIPMMSSSFESIYASQGMNSQINEQDIVSLAFDDSQGQLRQTKNSSHIALSGDGYFVVTTSYGDRLTRRGDLAIDSEGFLTIKTGERLQGLNGEIPVHSDNYKIDHQGNIAINDNKIDQLRVVNVDNPQNLSYLGTGMYDLNLAQLVEIDPEAQKTYTVSQGYLEGSNVNTTTEMIAMIALMRHFESTHEALLTYDSMLDQTINKLADFRG